MPGTKGRSGRRPKPTKLKVLEGGKVAKKAAEKMGTEAQPEVSSSVPPPPDHLGNVAKAYWISMAEPLYKCGLLTVADMTAFEMMCVVYEDWQEAVIGSRKGPYVQDPSVPRDPKTKQPMYVKGIRNPDVARAKEAFRQLKSMQTEFGMTPSSRSKVEGAGTLPPPAAETGKPAAPRWVVGQLPDM